MSEETKNSLVKAGETRLPQFVEDAYQTIEKMEGFANILLKSKLVPNHFYEQLPDKKPDFSKGKVEAVVAVLIQAYQLDIPPMTALQHIIPVNGLLSIKGDLAKSMIFNSGVLKKGSWKEEEFGSIEEGNLVVKITATRDDNGQTITRSFSVEQAKRAGLWITESQANGSDGWKYRASAWWKYPARMINYRALGFLARDLFPDVLAGIYTTEEAMDLPVDQTVILDQGNGTTLQIPDKGFAEERSKKITDRAVSKISDKNFTPVKEEKNYSENNPEANNPAHADKLADIAENESPFKAEKGSVAYMDGKEVSRDGELLVKDDDSELRPGYTIEKMMSMETDDLLSIVNSKQEMIEAMMQIPGKNTNKKLREIIFAFNEGTLDEHIQSLVPDEDPPVELKNQAGDTIDGQTEVPGEAPASHEIPINKNFDNQGPKKDELIQPDTTELNKYKMAIPAFNKGNERDFVAVKELYQNMSNIKLNNERFLELQKDIPEFAHFKSKEDFCKYATIEEVSRLLNENYISL